MFGNEEIKPEAGSNRVRWLAWFAAIGSWLASVIFMVMAKDESFPNMPDWVMYLVWFVAQAAELLLVLSLVVLFKYFWGLAFSDELKQRQTPFMTGRILTICVFSIFLGVAPALFDLWSTNLVLMAWVNHGVGIAVLFARWLGFFVVLGSELALSMNDDVQKVYSRLGFVESKMSLVEDEESLGPKTVVLPDGVSKGEAYRRLSELSDLQQGMTPELEGA